MNIVLLRDMNQVCGEDEDKEQKKNKVLRCLITLGWCDWDASSFSPFDHACEMPSSSSKPASTHSHTHSGTVLESQHHACSIAQYRSISIDDNKEVH